MNLNKNKNKPIFNKLTNKITNKLTNKPTNQTTNQTTSITNKVKEISEKVLNAATNLGGKINKSVTDIKQNITNKISNTTEKAKTSTGQDASKVVGKVQEFMQANSAISKFVAVVLSIIVFYMLFNICIYILSQYFMPTTHAKVIDGLVPSNIQLQISANPNVSNSVPILRSVNQSQGLEYTWDVWFFVKDVKTMDGYGLIFSKGLAKCSPSLSKSYTSGNNTCKPSNNSSLLGVCPGAYIIKSVQDQAELVIAINTLVDPSLNNSGFEEMTISDIPLNKWVHCAIRVQNNAVDIYINGVMTQRKNLQTLPLQNYYDTYVGDQYSFNGYISSLNYYAYALNYDQIQNDYVKGPNMNLQGQSTQINYKDYLAMNWHYKS